MNNYRSLTFATFLLHQRLGNLRLCDLQIGGFRVVDGSVTLRLDAIFRAGRPIAGDGRGRRAASQQFPHGQLQFGRLEGRQGVGRRFLRLLALGRDREVFRLEAAFRRRRLVHAAPLDARRILHRFACRCADIWTTIISFSLPRFLSKWTSVSCWKFETRRGRGSKGKRFFRRASGKF